MSGNGYTKKKASGKASGKGYAGEKHRERCREKQEGVCKCIIRSLMEERYQEKVEFVAGEMHQAMPFYKASTGNASFYAFSPKVCMGNVYIDSFPPVVEISTEQKR